jgi:phage baseplate assembly protein W
MATETTYSNVTRSYKDLDLNFAIHPIKKDINKVIGENAVIASLRNLLLTAQFERPFQPYLGGNIKALLFEPLDVITAKNLEVQIKTTVDNFEPRVIVQSVLVKPDFDNNGFIVNLTFRLVNQLNPIQITFFLERVR